MRIPYHDSNHKIREYCWDESRGWFRETRLQPPSRTLGSLRCGGKPRSVGTSGCTTRLRTTAASAKDSISSLIGHGSPSLFRYGTRPRRLVLRPWCASRRYGSFTRIKATLSGRWSAIVGIGTQGVMAVGEEGGAVGGGGDGVSVPDLPIPSLVGTRQWGKNKRTPNLSPHHKMKVFGFGSHASLGGRWRVRVQCAREERPSLLPIQLC